MPPLNPNISIGTHNADVQHLQTTLRQLGHAIAESEVNQQLFGPVTEAAVQAFQRAQGIPPTGVVDEA